MSLVSPQVRRGVYHGWRVVVAVFVLGVARAPFTGFIFGVFVKPMSEEFGWSRALFTGAAAVGTLVGGASAYFAGRVVDRYGPRVLMGVSTVVIGGVYIALGWTPGLLVFYVAYVVGRALSQSASSEAMYAAVVSKWFVRLRGRAVAIASLGGPLGGAVLALMAQALINSYGWRWAWVAFGALAWAIALAPAALFLRRTPEDMGLRPDGDVATDAADASKGRDRRARRWQTEYHWPFADALRTRAFWALSTVGLVGSLASTAVAFHLIPYFTDIGIDPTMAVLANSVYTLFFAGGVFVWGFLMERVDVQVGYMASLVLVTAGIVLVVLTHSTPMAFAATAVYGIGQGGWFINVHTIWAMYYGRRHLGAIRGLTMFFQMLGNSVGPLFSAMVFDASGSYRIAFVVSSILTFICLLLLALARRPAAGGTQALA